ncbi:MAG: hypothetical protein O3C10_00935 [Chloroflexi bacterium]|nr:hypothetical protein [Chloroflexota bacterium]
MTVASKSKLPLIAAMAITLFAFSAATITAHESRTAGDLSYVVGWLDEPAYEGFPNGVSVRITGPIETATGALFEGGALGPGAEFTYTFGRELEDSIVPYHNHLNPELGGTVTVTATAPEGDVEIEISATGFSPADVMIRPDSSVTWRNVDTSPQAVHSGEGMMGMEQDDGEPMDGATAGDTAAGAEGDDHEHELTAPTGPVEGLEGSLQVEVTHVATGITRTLTLESAFQEPGHYVAALIPTAPGAYTFHLTGDIDASPIDETFESGPGTFDDVLTQASIQFPLQVSAPREIEGAARGAEDAAAIAESAADGAADDASSAQTLAIIAIVIGIGGLAVGAGGVTIGLKRR